MLLWGGFSAEGFSVPRFRRVDGGVARDPSSRVSTLEVLTNILCILEKTEISLKSFLRSK